MEHFFIFYFSFKNRHSAFYSSGQYFNNSNNNNNNMPSLLPRHSPTNTSMSSTQTHGPPYPDYARQHVTHANHASPLHVIHASTSSGPFLKLKFPPLKSCCFRNFDSYFDQETFIIKRHLQVHATCYSKFGTCTWMSSQTLLYITVYIFEYIS